MREYTPDTCRVRGFYKHATGWSFDHDPQPHIAAMMEKQAAEFDRWLAETVRAAKAEGWDEGHRVGWEHCQDGNYGTDYWDDDTPNPHDLKTADQ